MWSYNNYMGPKLKALLALPPSHPPSSPHTNLSPTVFDWCGAPFKTSFPLTSTAEQMIFFSKAKGDGELFGFSLRRGSSLTKLKDLDVIFPSGKCMILWVFEWCIHGRRFIRKASFKGRRISNPHTAVTLMVRFPRIPVDKIWCFLDISGRHPKG